jgi:hypothetical protein
MPLQIKSNHRPPPNRISLSHSAGMGGHGVACGHPKSGWVAARHPPGLGVARRWWRTAPPSLPDLTTPEREIISREITGGPAPDPWHQPLLLVRKESILRERERERRLLILRERIDRRHFCLSRSHCSLCRSEREGDRQRSPVDGERGRENGRPSRMGG